MSTEIVKYDDSYLTALTEGSAEEVDELAGEVNPTDLMPRLILPRDGTRDIKCVIGEDTLFTKKRVHAFVVWVGARRTLWQPEGMGGEMENMPVCTTGIQSVGKFRRNDDQGQGMWVVKGNEGLPAPYGADVQFPDDPSASQEAVSCNTCRFNQFGSAPLWDEGKENAGKACKEGRLLALRIAEKTSSFMTNTGEDVGLFSFNESSPVVLMQLSATSIKTVKKMATAAVSRNIALSKIVWSLGAEIKENGSITWSVLDANVAGYPVREVLSQLSADRDYVKSLFTAKPTILPEEMGF